MIMTEQILPSFIFILRITSIAERKEENSEYYFIIWHMIRQEK